MAMLPLPHGFLRLDESHLERASQVFTRAFHNDALQSYVFPDEDERRRLSPAHFNPLVRLGLMAGEVWASDENLSGLCIAVPPGKKIQEEELVQSGFFELPQAIGQVAFDRFAAFLQHVEPFHLEDVKGDHWYIFILGVDAQHQGKGLGAKLLAPVFADADEKGLPCYLETAQASNVRFYEKVGFKVRRSGTEPKSGLAFWTFLREPAGK